jgi:hypothetical protein
MRKYSSRANPRSPGVYPLFRLLFRPFIKTSGGAPIQSLPPKKRPSEINPARPDIHRMAGGMIQITRNHHLEILA